MSNIPITPGSGLLVAANTIQRPSAVAPEVFQNIILADGTTGTSAAVDSTGAMQTRVAAIGSGAFQTVTASQFGTAIVTGAPALSVGVRVYLPQGASFTYTLATAAPTGTPAIVVTVSNPTTGASPLVYNENLSGGLQMYVTQVSGGVVARYV